MKTLDAFLKDMGHKENNRTPDVFLRDMGRKENDRTKTPDAFLKDMGRKENSIYKQPKNESLLVTEISKKTLNSYLDKSKGPDYPDEKTFRKRMIGGATALRKLGKKIPGYRSQPKVKIKATNETLDEVEINEISVKTTSSYMNKVRAGAEARTSKPSRIKGFETAQNKQYGARFGFKEPKVKATNETLDEALNFDASFPDVWAALAHVNSITEQYGITLPEIEELEDDEFGEEVFQVDEDAYLYFCYALNEQGEYDIVSGVFNSSELDELLSEEE